MKRRSRFYEHFPPPRALAMPAIGLDISDRSLRFAELVQKRGGFVLGVYGERDIPEGAIAGGNIVDASKMQGVLKQLHEEIGFDFVRVSLPEQQSYLVKMEIPRVRKSHIRESIELQLEEHVPISPEKAVFDYTIVAEGGHDRDHLDIGVSVMPKEVIDQYLEVFTDTGMTPVSFELEAQAIARSVLAEGDMGTYMVVDIGGIRTGISIISKGIIRFTTTIDLGGHMLTRLIARRFGMSEDDARAIKEKRGIMQNKDNAELANALMPLVSSIQDEINRHYLYWNTHGDAEDKKHPKIEKVLLCGGEANVPGLPEYLSIVLRADVELANPWRNIAAFDEYIPEIPYNHSLRYATSLGLAMLNFQDS